MGKLNRAEIYKACGDVERRKKDKPKIVQEYPAKNAVGPIVRYTEQGNPVKVWASHLDTNAWTQAQSFADMSFVHPKGLALMPDVHFGKDVPVGSVLPTVGAIVPAAVGTDIGCFTGDTQVVLADDSKNHTMASLVNKEFYVFACNSDGHIEVAAATCVKTRSNATLVKVYLDNGEIIRCTPDHQFMMRDGSYKEAKDLEATSSLMPLYSQIDKDGYFLIKQNKSGESWQRAHWVVARSGLMGEIPGYEDDKTIIHHRDFIRTNNRVENLEFMSSRAHSRYHSSLVERNTFWQSKQFEENRIKAIKDKANTEEGYKYYSERCTKNILQYMKERPEHFKNAVKDNGKRGKKTLIAYNTSQKGIEKSKEIANRMYVCEICGANIKSPIGLHNHRKNIHQCNHKVMKVEFIEEKEDVYCLKVPGLNNFALAAGVFVHNCGMVAVRLNVNAKQLPDHLAKVRRLIERRVPLSAGGRHKEIPQHILQAWNPLAQGHKWLEEQHPRAFRPKAMEQLGTLGSGNHFIEVCLDESQQVWVMLHSGSRGAGSGVGQYFIDEALRRARLDGSAINGLGWLREEDPLFADYVQAVEWAQQFASINRQCMMHAAIEGLSEALGRPVEPTMHAVNCHHNYIAREKHYGGDVWVTRKGAIRAQKGDLGIIPSAMGQESFIVEGLGETSSFCSCSHGAGRVMSRSAAQGRFTAKDLRAQTTGVECRKDRSVVDEIPSAYKPIKRVMEDQRDLVVVKHRIKAVVCIKGV